MVGVSLGEPLKQFKRGIKTPGPLEIRNEIHNIEAPFFFLIFFPLLSELITHSNLLISNNMQAFAKTEGPDCWIFQERACYVT